MRHCIHFEFTAFVGSTFQQNQLVMALNTGVWLTQQRVIKKKSFFNSLLFMILGYLVDVDSYLGKVTSNSQREVKIGENVVLRLCKEYYFTRRLICANNFFSSIPLTQKRWANGLEFISTLR
jgi:hypothetical protein